MTDDKQKIAQVYEYDSYGNQHDSKNSIKQPYGYTGREHDRETGLRYYRARYYDGEVGAFLSKDPLGFEGGINLYSYVGNDPINLIDPYGLREWTISRKGVGVSAVIVGLSGQKVTFESNCEDGIKITQSYLVGGIGLTVGVRISLWGDSEGHIGETKVSQSGPDPYITGMSFTGPSIGLGYGGSIGSVNMDFKSYSEAHLFTEGYQLGASLFNFEGQTYYPLEPIIEKCCE